MAGATTTQFTAADMQSSEEPSDERTPFDFAAWLIDLDGTLYRQKPVRAVMALQVALQGRSVVPVIQEFRREHERLHHVSLPAGANPFELQIERTADRLCVDSEDVQEIIEQWMFVRPLPWLRLFRRRQLLGQIAKFRARGGKTAVVSDYPASRKLAAMGIAGQFELVVAAGEPDGPHQLKPSPAGYLLAASTLGVGPDECLVIGDRADVDGEAARRAGMHYWQVGTRWTS
jgi:HAD superfamily hydrolase (TIGR01509 family)